MITSNTGVASDTLVEITEHLGRSGITVTYFAIGYFREQMFHSYEIQMIHTKYRLSPAQSVPVDPAQIKIILTGLTEKEITLLRGLICKDIHSTGDLTEEELMTKFEELR